VTIRECVPLGSSGAVTTELNAPVNGSFTWARPSTEERSGHDHASTRPPSRSFDGLAGSANVAGTATTRGVAGAADELDGAIAGTEVTVIDHHHQRR
jgi:hypothetical protein